MRVCGVTVEDPADETTPGSIGVRLVHPRHVFRDPLDGHSLFDAPRGGSVETHVERHRVGGERDRRGSTEDHSAARHCYSGDVVTDAPAKFTSRVDVVRRRRRQPEAGAQPGETRDHPARGNVLLLLGSQALDNSLDRRRYVGTLNQPVEEPQPEPFGDVWRDDTPACAPDQRNSERTRW